MACNVELKARCHNLPALRNLVGSLGATGPEVLVQIDTFFRVSSGRLKLREFGDQRGELIAYRRPDLVGPTLSTYQRVPVVEPARLKDILNQALGIDTTVRKRREVFLLDQTRIHLDDVESLGTFVELEVVLRDGQPASEGHDLARHLLYALAISSTDLIAEAYADLLVGKRVTSSRSSEGS